MKTPNYQIQIAKPCHEDWNKMLPETQGKFCQSCCKAVIDFTGKSDLEIHTLLMEKKGEKVCGHFRTSQINRPLNIRIAWNDLPANMSTTRRFTVVLLLVFGSALFSITDLKGQQINNVKVEDTEVVSYLKGKVRCVKPVVEDQVPVRTDQEEPEPRIMGDIAYFEPEEPDTVVEIIEESMMMGGVRLVEDELVLSEQEVENQELLPENSEAILNISEEIPEFVIYPNPSRGDFTVRYELPKKTDVTIVMLDEKGNVVRTIVDIKQQYEGQYNIPVNTAALPAGIYVLVSCVDERRFSNKVVVEK